MMEGFKSGRTDLVSGLIELDIESGNNADGGVSLLQWYACYGGVTAVRCLSKQGAQAVLLGRPQFNDLMGIQSHNLAPHEF